MDRSRNRRTALGAALVIALAAVAGFSALAPNALAQTTTTEEDIGLGFKGLGARVGLVDPEGASGTIDLGVHIDAGNLARNVRVSPIVEYWSVGVADVDFSDLAVGIDLMVDFPLQDSRLNPYVGGGIGMHWLSFDDPVLDVSDSDTKFGFNLMGGVATEAMPNLALFGELRYNFVSDANQLKILGGFTYRFIY